VASRGISVLTGGTDVHLVVLDLRACSVDGKQAEDRLAEVGITVNRNAVPFDPRPPMISSGLRIGTPALATRGFGDKDFRAVADIIAEALAPDPSPERQSALRSRVARLTDGFPLYAPLRGDTPSAHVMA
jgi:glycine hydroxymethyltransferase